MRAHAALVRVWQTVSDEDDSADVFQSPVWLPCSLKLSGTSVKIIMPNKCDTEREFPSVCSFEQVTGWTIPIQSFERIQLERNISMPSECGDNPFFNDMTCRITFITNLEAGDREVSRSYHNLIFINQILLIL